MAAKKLTPAIIVPAPAPTPEIAAPAPQTLKVVETLPDGAAVVDLFPMAANRKRYLTLTADTKQALSHAVEEHINDGWALVGGVSMGPHNIYAQAVTR